MSRSPDPTPAAPPTEPSRSPLARAIVAGAALLRGTLYGEADPPEPDDVTARSGSYHSAGDRRVLVGLGDADRAGRVVVTWPSGRRQEFRDWRGDRGWRLREGKSDAEEIR